MIKNTEAFYARAKQYQDKRAQLVSDYEKKLESLKSRATELEIRINSELFGEARVIASTLVGAANRLLDGQKYAT